MLVFIEMRSYEVWRATCSLTMYQSEFYPEYMAYVRCVRPQALRPTQKKRVGASSTKTKGFVHSTHRRNTDVNE